MADLTLQEAAAELGLSPDTLRWQIHHGKLKARKVGPPGRDYWTVSRREVERYRRDNQRQQPEGQE